MKHILTPHNPILHRFDLDHPHGAFGLASFSSCAEVSLATTRSRRIAPGIHYLTLLGHSGGESLFFGYGGEVKKHQRKPERGIEEGISSKSTPTQANGPNVCSNTYGNNVEMLLEGSISIIHRKIPGVSCWACGDVLIATPSSIILWPVCVNKLLADSKLISATPAKSQSYSGKSGKARYFTPIPPRSPLEDWVVFFYIQKTTLTQAQECAFVRVWRDFNPQGRDLPESHQGPEDDQDRSNESGPMPNTVV
ncbi:MAG: hypothetical protein RJB39_688 [Candidatus Parcubacteria bacterium]|jgi:hypothetical protein